MTEAALGRGQAQLFSPLLTLPSPIPCKVWGQTNDGRDHQVTAGAVTLDLSRAPSLALALGNAEPYRRHAGCTIRHHVRASTAQEARKEAMKAAAEGLPAHRVSSRASAEPSATNFRPAQSG
jgi:hypothetical protein